MFNKFKIWRLKRKLKTAETHLNHMKESMEKYENAKTISRFFKRLEILFQFDRLSIEKFKQDMEEKEEKCKKIQNKLNRLS